MINTFLQAPDKKGVNHGKGVSSVIKKMDEKFNDRFSVGIIDKDRREIKRIKADFAILNNKIPDFAILYKHNSKPHYLIQICPVSETWICNVAREINVNLVSEHWLPDNPGPLEDYTKKITSNYDIRFINLFKNILNKSEQTNFEPVLKMKTWLRLLADDTYNVDIKELEK